MAAGTHTIPATPASIHERFAIRHQTFDSIAVIGLGAIGGSLAWGARLAGVTRVIGHAPDPCDAEAAERAGAVTELALTPESAVAHARLVVLAAPPAATLELIDRLAGHLAAGAVLSDVASVKVGVLAQACASGLQRSFAGAHPLAGTHGSGFASAAPELLRGCVVYVCSTGESGRAAAERVAAFWATVLKAKPVFLDAGEHDRRLAWTSHLPQAVASALARALADRDDASEFGTGARDTTRLAASSPTLWADIFLQNRDAIITAIDAVDGRLRALRDLIDRRDAPGLRAFLESASAFRRGLDQ